MDLYENFQQIGASKIVPPKENPFLSSGLALPKNHKGLPSRALIQRVVVKVSEPMEGKM
jgi:hypothetical protein